MKPNGHADNGKLLKGLSSEARTLYDDTVQTFGLDDSASLTLLLNACFALDRLRKNEGIVAKEGSVFHDRFQQVRQHPACARIDKESQNVIRALHELGLDLSTVSARGGTVNAPAPGLPSQAAHGADVGVYLEVFTCAERRRFRPPAG
jgi:hypothetical protein